MPTICKTDTCRNKAVYGFDFLRPLFCSSHREPESKNVRFIAPTDLEKKGGNKCKNCSSQSIEKRYKEYCSGCYVKLFPLDPLSLQTVYKSKAHIIRKYIDSKFDGFSHETGYSKIKINGSQIYVVYAEQPTIGTTGPTIFIKFNPDKYENNDGSYSNPLLYTRMPYLEKEISKQIDRVVNKENGQLVETVEMYMTKCT